MPDRYLAVQLAGLKLAVPAAAVNAVHHSLDVFPVAATCEWFLGLAVVQGKLLPVSDLGLWLGLRRTAGACLELDRHLVQAGIQVDSVLAIVEQAATVESAGSAGGGEGTSDALWQQQQRGLEKLRSLGLLGNKAIRHEDANFHCLDITALAQSPQFLQVGAPA